MCGLFGFFRYGKGTTGAANLKVLAEKLSHGAAIRGTHATGVAYMNVKKELVIDKAPESAYKFKGCDKIPYDTRVVMGHTRHTTQGSEKKNYNNHPFLGIPNKKESFALAHNGVLDNDRELKRLHNLPDDKIETDSYVAAQLVTMQKTINMDTVKWMAEQVEGMFTFTLLDNKNQLWVVKNDSPFHIIHFPKLELYVYASTLDILHNALLDFTTTKTIMLDILQGNKAAPEEMAYIAPTPGQLLCFKQDGTYEMEAFKPQDRVSKYQNRWLKQQANGGGASPSYGYGRGWEDEYYGYGYQNSQTTRGNAGGTGTSQTRVGTTGSSSTTNRAESATADDQKWYLEYLKNYAFTLGHEADTIDKLRAANITFDEIEEALYGDSIAQLLTKATGTNETAATSTQVITLEGGTRVEV